MCDLSAEEIKATRGTLTEPGKESPYRNRTIEENLDRIKHRYSDRKIFTVNACNDLAQLTGYLTRLMKVKAIQMVPANPLKSLWIILKARVHGLNANIPPLF